MGALSAYGVTSQIVKEVYSGTEPKDLKSLINDREVMRSTEGVFYSSVFQAGLSEVVLGGTYGSPPVSDFVRQRTSYIDEGLVQRYWEFVEGYFKPHIGIRWSVEDTSLIRLLCFLEDLLVAMESQTDLLLATNIPDPVECEGLIPADILVPISNLISTFEHETPPVPMPRAVADVESVETFQEIINSDLFSQYGAAQQMIDSEAIPRDKAIDEITKTGRMLFKAHTKLIGLRRTSMALLSVTPKLIDVAFGKLPSVLAEVVTDLASKLMHKKRRLVIYQTQNLLLDFTLRPLLESMSTSPGKPEKTSPDSN